MAQQRWRSAVRKLAPAFFSHDEVRAMEAKIGSEPGSEIEALASSEEHPLKLAMSLKYLIKPAQETDIEWPCKFDQRLVKTWTLQTQLPRDESFFPEHIRSSTTTGQIVDMIAMLDWLPREENLYSLGREGSSRVTRITAMLTDIGLPDFSSFWAANKNSILARIPPADLQQRATLESDSVKRIDSYLRQQRFLSSLAAAIASVRGLTVEIELGIKGAEDSVYEGGYYRKPDSLIRIGDTTGSIEQKTQGADAEKIAKARGQIVVLGNLLIRQKSRYLPVTSLRNEMYGFVGDGVQLQCLRQVHAYNTKVRAYDGRLLALAQGDIDAGDLFTIDLNSDAVVWAAAALDRMVVSDPKMLQAAAGVSNDHCFLDDYGQLKLVATSGYSIGDETVALAGSGPVDDLIVTVLGAARNNDMSVVLRVLWNEEVWWLKMGPKAETRQKALVDDEMATPGAWERWFQTERDMLSRSMLLGESDSAFPVAVEAARNRSAMFVKDAGDSLEKRLLATQKMEPAEVYEMSKQLYGALEQSGNRGVFHGDVCLENICEKNGSYSLIDWGLACGRPFQELATVVGKVWPALDVRRQIPGIPNWEMSPDCCFLGARPHRVEHDLESLLYCCIKLLGGNVLPWTDAAASGSDLDVLNLRAATVASLVEAHGSYIFRPLLRKLGLVSAHEFMFTAKDKPGNISSPAAQESEILA